MVISLLLAGGVAGTALSQRWLVDDASPGSLLTVIAAVGLGVLAHTVTVMLGRHRANLSQLLNDRVVLSLNQDVLGWTARIPTVEHLEKSDYLNRLTLTLNGAHGLAAFCWTVAETTTAALGLTFSLWLLASVHPALILLALCALPPLWLGHRAERMVRRLSDELAEVRRLERHLHELCLQPGPAMELRIAGSDRELSRRADALWEIRTSREAAVRLRGTALQTLGWLCFSIGLITALAHVAGLVTEGKATTGDVVMIITLGSQLRQQVASTLTGVARVSEAGRVTDHYVWLREYTAGQPTGTGPAPGRLATGISLHGLTFRHQGAEQPVLRDLTLTLPAGSVIGLVGVNGAGKTTLVKMLTGLYRPTEGEIRVDGQRLADLDPAGWSAKCSAVFQDFAKLQVSVRESVGVGDLGRVHDTEAVARAIDRAGAKSVVEELPNGLDTQLGSLFGGTELSHGQWQKLAVARGGMRNRPLLVVLDEPTSALDPQAEHDLFDRFSAHARAASTENGAVTLLVSHRFSTVHMADLIIVLGEGRVAELGTHVDLMSLDGLYAELYRAQASNYCLSESQTEAPCNTSQPRDTEIS